HRVTLGISADVEHLLPANLAPLFEGVSKIAATALVDAPMRVQIETLTARTAGFGASVTGTVDGAAGPATPCLPRPRPRDPAPPPDRPGQAGCSTDRCAALSPARSSR